MSVPGAPLEGRAFKYLQNVIHLASTPSTNDMGKAIVEKMLAESEDILPTVIVAEAQTAGRGRGGRIWTPLPGALAVSVLVPWPEGPERVRLPIRVGVVLARGLSSAFGLEVRLKWPNDLLVKRKKLGGILVEARANDSGEGWAVVGIGLNVLGNRKSLDASGLPEATSLEDCGVAAGKLKGNSALSALLEILDSPLEEPGDLPIADSFAAVAAHAVGDPLTVSDRQRVVSGVFRGVNEDGALRLATPLGEEILVSGDVVLF
jgi:BirA family transcriptional regulator, biotin operon repressor / biotin---[acetyl-CoA-carboxylase] ligase